MEISPTHKANQLLKSLSLNRTAGFTGVGIVFYQNLAGIPHIDLGHPTLNRPNLPVEGLEAIIATLVAAADISSPWHDGFHFISLTNISLTHLSQFIAPSLDMYDSVPLCKRPSGARHMTASLVSNSEGIECVGLLTSSGELCVFKNGIAEIREDFA